MGCEGVTIACGSGQEDGLLKAVMQLQCPVHGPGNATSQRPVYCGSIIGLEQCLRQTQSYLSATLGLAPPLRRSSSSRKA